MLTDIRPTFYRQKISGPSGKSRKNVFPYALSGKVALEIDGDVDAGAAIVLQSRVERDAFEHVQIAPIAQVYDLGRSELIAGIGEIVDICIFHYDLGFHFPAAIVLVDVVVRSAARSA